jgi:hypothetical protein
LSNEYEYDFFIAHASEDKNIAEPLVHKLAGTGARVWYDRIVLTLGDSLREKIDEGLASSRYGIVILSPYFFEKNWPPRELNGLVAREVDGRKVVLPIWHNISADEVRQYSPILADRLAALTSSGLDSVVDEILRVAGVADARTGPTSEVPDIEIPLVQDTKPPTAEEQPGMLLGRGSLYELEDASFELMSDQGEAVYRRQVGTELRALRVALLDRRPVGTLVGDELSNDLLSDPELRLKESLVRIPALIKGISDIPEGRASGEQLLTGLSSLYTSIPPVRNDRVQDPLGIQQRFLYSAYAVGAIAVDQNWPSAARALMGWRNAEGTYWEDRSWIRYVATMLARQKVVGKSIINFVKEDESLEQYLQGTLGGEDGAWNRLCQFDFLQCARNLATGGELSDCFASFSIFRRQRVQPIVETLIDSHADGTWLPALDAHALAKLIVTLDDYAFQWAGFEYDTWAIDRWSSGKIRMFLTEQGFEVR